MKNSIRENRAAEIEAKAAEQAIREENEILVNIPKKNIVETMDEVGGTNHIVYNENDNVLGLNGNIYQTTLDSKTTIAANSPEELEALKDAIKNGMNGDGYYHKTVNIGGYRCDCADKTVEDLEKDILEAKKYHAGHPNLFGLIVAEQLVDAGYEQNDLKQLDICGYDCFISYSERRLFTKDGKTVADLDNIKAELGREDIETLLTERGNVIMEERAREEAEEYDDDDYDEYYDDEEEYEDEEDDDDEDSGAIVMGLMLD